MLDPEARLQASPSQEALQALIEIRQSSRRERLWDQAKGRKLLSWGTAAYLALIGLMLYLAVTDRAGWSAGASLLFVIPVYVQAVSMTHLQKRLNAVTELLEFHENQLRELESLRKAAGRVVREGTRPD